MDEEAYRSTGGYWLIVAIIDGHQPTWIFLTDGLTGILLRLGRTGQRVPDSGPITEFLGIPRFRSKINAEEYYQHEQKRYCSRY